jgi:hypothetical protein
MQLTTQDLFIAAQAGILRHISAIARDRPERYGVPPGDRWGVNIEACISEYLVAQVTNRSWRPFVAVPGDLPADVGLDIQVRHTHHLHGSLIFYEKDSKDQIYVLVVGSHIKQKIAGWIIGRDGMRQEFWKHDAREPGYFVPQSALRPISELIK